MKSFFYAWLAMPAMLLVGCGKSEPQAAATPAIAPTDVAAIDTPPPEYPVQLACAGIGGTTELMVVIGPEGTLTDVKLNRSSGQAALDEAAQSKVKTWRFKPATRNGKPIPQTIKVPVAFNPPQPKPDGCFAIEEQARRGG